MIVIAGEALPPCVARTVRVLANDLGEDNIRKLVLLTDCTSPASELERQGELFLDELAARGTKMAATETLLL